MPRLRRSSSLKRHFDPVAARGDREGVWPDASELRVMLAMVDVGGAPEVAEALGVAALDRQDPSRPGLCEDRRVPPGRSRQARRGIFERARLVGPP